MGDPWNPMLYQMQPFNYPQQMYPSNPNPIDYGPQPHFEVRQVTHQSGSFQGGGTYTETVETFIVPVSQPNNVLAFTGFQMMKAEGHKQIPVPYKEYNYLITNFQGSFLQMMVPYEELQAFLYEVSQKMRQSTKVANTAIMKCLLVTLIIIACLVGLSGLGLLIEVIFRVSVPYLVGCFFFIFLAPCLLFAYYIAKRRQRVQLAFVGYNNLVSIIHQMKHQFLGRGILVRPGNYGAFIQFVPIINS